MFEIFVCITVILPLKTQTIVSCLYRKHSSKIYDFTECIESMFSCIKGSIFICGDLNIDLLNYDVNGNKRNLFIKCLHCPYFP